MHRLDETGAVIRASEILPLLRGAFRQWRQDKAPRLAASLSYYALFSLVPILLISIAIAGFVFGEEAARGQILREVGGVVGDSVARGIEEMLQSAQRQPRGGTFAVFLGFGLLLFGAAGVFNQLKDALNTIWEVPASTRSGILRLIRERFLSFAMVLVVGFLLLVSLVISASLAAASKYLSDRIPGNETLWLMVNLVVSMAVIAVLFALIFRYVPDQRISWRDVWLGAAFTSILLNIGKLAIGLYLGRGTFASAYGAAGSLVVILVWTYYSSMLLFFGAEFTEVYARRRRGLDAVRRRRGDAEILRPVFTASPGPRVPASRGGRVVPVLTGCGGLLLGILIGVISAFLGVVVTTLRSLTKKLKS